MSKQLLIVRHAKSDRSDPDLADFDRPLNRRGHNDAPKMAERLLKKHIIPQLLVSSPAKRAITTAEYFADILHIDKKKIQQQIDIYEASSSRLLNVINNFDNKYDFIALFGHNPGLSNLAVHLSNNAVSDIPTSGMVLIKFSLDDWTMITNGDGELQFFDYPKSTD